MSVLLACTACIGITDFAIFKAGHNMMHLMVLQADDVVLQVLL